MRRLRPCSADSVSFSIPHPPGIPWVPEVDSAEGMRTFFELLQTHVQAKEFDLRQVIAEGDDVVLIGQTADGKGAYRYLLLTPVICLARRHAP